MANWLPAIPYPYENPDVSAPQFSINMAGVLSLFRKINGDEHGTSGGYPCPCVSRGSHPVYGGTVIVDPDDGRDLVLVFTPTLE